MIIKTVYKNILLVLLVLLGIFMFIFGEFDDSPGGQLLGLLMVIGGIVFLIKGRQRKSLK